MDEEQRLSQHTPDSAKGSDSVLEGFPLYR